MATETLRPTTHTTDGTVTDPADGYDANTGTNALIQQAADNNTAHEEMLSFPAGAITPANRTAVTLYAHGEWSSGDNYDVARLMFKAQVGDDWTVIHEKYPNSGVENWGASGSGGTLLSFDITALAAAHAATGFYVKWEFFNGSASFPDPPAEN